MNLEYRNKIILRARARTNTFKDNYQNYYWYRLEELNNSMFINPSIGIIRIKKPSLNR